MTGAKLDVQGDATLKQKARNSSSSKIPGFSLDCELFEKTFGFVFEGTLEKVLLEFDENIPASILAKGPHSKKSEFDSIPCPVCGSTDQRMVLDLGNQPFANDFLSNANVSKLLPRFPLKLVRCRHCNLYHLSHVASREDLFSHYLYRSGTSSTLKKYFDWLANKVKEESDNNTQREYS